MSDEKKEGLREIAKELPGVHAEFAGGMLLYGAPLSWEEAYAWADASNKDKDLASEQPTWSFDCGFKLDFDGPLVGIDSRFYPPAEHYGPKWDGTVSVCVMGIDILEEKFEEETLDDLRAAVEKFVGGLVEGIVIKKKQKGANDE